MKISEHTYKNRIIKKIVCLILVIPVIITAAYFFRSEAIRGLNHFNDMSIRSGFEDMLQNGELWNNIKQEEVQLFSQCGFDIEGGLSYSPVDNSNIEPTECINQGAQTIKNKYSEFVEFGTTVYMIGSISLDKDIAYTFLFLLIVPIALILRNFLYLTKKDLLLDEQEPSDHILYYALVLIPLLFSTPFLLSYIIDGSFLQADWGGLAQLLLGIGLAILYAIVQIIYFIVTNSKYFSIRKILWVLFRTILFIGFVILVSTFISIIYSY